jgi:aldose 1-epimerase
MFYHIDSEERGVAGQRETIYALKHAGGLAEAEVWPAHGFNCLRWRVNTGAGLQDVLYAAAEWETNPVPTRSGVPILFPFPNRIRAGKFAMGGRNFELPLNDSTRQNAIHGFAPRHPWRVFGYRVEHDNAWIHADFQPAIDAPESIGHWTGSGLLSVTCRLSEAALRLECRVRNMGDEPFPFGLGFHPYFRFPCADDNVERCKLLAPARSIWQLAGSLPTGERLPVPDDCNFNRPRPITGVQLDTLYADLDAIAQRDDGLLLRAELGHAELPGAVQIWTSADFRESVLFTPPHRRALCVEPYTCATDAVNLAERGIDAGWKVLRPGSDWSGIVEFRWSPVAST